MKARLIAVLALCSCAFASHAQSPAFQDGYRKGFQDGYREGLEQGRREAAPSPAAPAAAPAPGATPAPAPAPVPAPAATPQPVGIVIVRAVYGDYFRQCDAASYVAQQVANRASVAFRVTNEMCGDPAPGKRKELKVVYRCGTAQRNAAASEHQEIALDCGR